ncbi:MAG: TolC family protein [Deltaproteobacteria bacterium]|nr:TolC family protein [Deltaproteobacteria bacterium]
MPEMCPPLGQLLWKCESRWLSSIVRMRILPPLRVATVVLLLQSGIGEPPSALAADPGVNPPAQGSESALAESEESGDQVLSLEEAYRLALGNEEQVKIAEHELTKAQLLPWRAMTLLSPRAAIDGVFTRNKEEIAFVRQGDNTGGGGSTPSPFGGTTSVIRPLESWQGNFVVTQPIFQPSFLPTLRLGKEAVKQSVQRYGLTIREVLFGVARAYYDVLRSREQVRVAGDTLRLTKEELKQAQARFRVGEVTKTDVLRAEVEVARAERTVIANQNTLQLTRATLVRVVGVPGFVRVVEPTPPTSRGERYDQLLEDAFSRRQDIRAQESAVEIARERKNQVLARYFPSINTQWNYPRLDTPTFANRDKFWVLTLNFQVPLYDGGVRELDLQEQQENVAQAELQLAQLKKNVGIDVRQALLNVETLEATLETLKKEVSLAQENHRITSKQYGVGLATSLDVNTALNTLTQVRTQLIDQTYAYQVALLALDHATGLFAQAYIPQR